MARKGTEAGGIDAVMSRVNKRMGEGTVMRMDGRPRGGQRVFSTGSIGVDAALGGGLPYGRLTEIYGPEASGKTTLTLHAIADVQRAGGLTAFVDAEHALDMDYAQALGVDPSRLLLSQPDCGEQALELVDLLASSGEVALIVVDSVAALTPRAEIEGEMGDIHLGLLARLMSQAMRKIAGGSSKHGTSVIFINQLRQKIGVTFGSPETTTGGNALKFFASVRLDVRRIGAVKAGDGTVLGNRTRVRVIKNKLAPPHRSSEFDMIYGRGICTAGELLDLGLDRGVVSKAGSWYAHGDERLGHGREKARELLMTDAGAAERLRRALSEALGLAPVEEEPAAEAA